MAITGIDTIEGKQIIAAGAVSAKSAEMAYNDENGNPITSYQIAGDYYSASNPSGFITGVDLTPYQTIEGMTAYQEAGDYYSASNPSGFISEVPAGTMNESAFEYDANNKISAYNGSAFAGGAGVSGDYELSAGEGISITDYPDDQKTVISVTGGQLPPEADEAISAVTANSGVWGGSALPISAGPGIKFEMVNDTLVASTDETVLFTTADIYKTTAFTLTEPLTSFEKVRFEITGYTNVYAENTHQTPSANNEEITTCFTYYCKSSDGNPLQMMMGTYTSTDGLNYGLARSKFLYMSNDGTTWNGNTTDGPHIQKIVGINRIAGGN